MSMPAVSPKPSLDLVLERTVDAPPDLVWRAWTEPEHLEKWFCPAPWTTPHCEIDLRPGGIFRTAPTPLVWTTALEPGFRPSSSPDSSGVPHFTAVIAIEAHATGARCTAAAMHRDEAGCRAHGVSPRVGGPP